MSSRYLALADKSVTSTIMVCVMTFHRGNIAVQRQQCIIAYTCIFLRLTEGKQHPLSFSPQHGQLSAIPPITPIVIPARLLVWTASTAVQHECESRGLVGRLYSLADS